MPSSLNGLPKWGFVYLKIANFTGRGMQELLLVPRLARQNPIKGKELTIHLMQILVGPVKAKGVRALQLPYRQKMMDNLSYALILSTAVDLALIAGSAVTLGRTLPLVPPIKETGHVLEMTLISLSQRPTDTSLECMKYPQSWLAIHATAPQGNLGSPLSPGTGPSWTKSMGLRQGDESALRRTASKGSTRRHTSDR